MKLGQLHEAGALSRMKDSVPDNLKQAHELEFTKFHREYVDLVKRMIEQAGFHVDEVDAPDDPRDFNTTAFMATIEHYPVSFHLNRDGDAFAEIELQDAEGTGLRLYRISDLGAAAIKLKRYAKTGQDD